MEYVKINPANLTEEEKAILARLAEKSKTKEKLTTVKDGEIFKVAGIEFIKFSDIDGVTTAVAKDIIFESDFGKNNNLANMKIIKRLEKEFMPKITEEVGAENIFDIETDLTTLDGVKTYGTITSKVSLPTLDFYRKHTEIFDKYKLDKWFWLATPWSALPHYESSCILCVSPLGDVYLNFYNFNFGVRPFLRFSSSIFVSNED